MDDLVFSLDSKKLLVEYRLFHESSENFKAFQIWDFDEKLSRENPRIVPYQPTSTAWNSVCLFDGDVVYVRDFNKNRRDIDFGAYELESKKHPVNSRELTSGEYAVAITQGTHRNAGGSVDMKGGPKGELLKLRMKQHAKLDPLTFHSLFSWREPSGEVFQLTLSHIQDYRYQVGLLGNDSNHLAEPKIEYEGQLPKESGNRYLSSVREYSRVEINPSSGCNFFCFEQGL